MTDINAGAAPRKQVGRKDTAGFTTLERWVGELDALFLRRNQADPLIAMPWRVWTQIIERVRR
jgi:hypothetical protein